MVLYAFAFFLLSDACLIHTNGENEPHGKNGGELVMGARESALLFIDIAVFRVDYDRAA